MSERKTRFARQMNSNRKHTQKPMRVPTGIDRAVAVAGSQSALARAIGGSQALIWAWLKQGYVPLKRVVEVEQVSGVPRMELIDPRLKSALETNVI